MISRCKVLSRFLLSLIYLILLSLYILLLQSTQSTSNLDIYRVSLIYLRINLDISVLRCLVALLVHLFNYLLSTRLSVRLFICWYGGLH